MNRGSGARKRVASNVVLPQNWTNFLRNDDNKDDLFQFLGHECVSKDTGDKVIISTIKVTLKMNHDTRALQPCCHEEADTRMILHVQDAVTSGFTSVMIRTVDTDVVLAVALFRGLPNIEALWVAFGTGKDFKYIPIHEIVTSMSPQMPRGLLFFHAFTGSDVTSFFTNYGKKSGWKMWLAWPDVTQTFATLSTPQAANLTEELILTLERFVVPMYCRTCDDTRVDAARMSLFSKMSRAIENIPPTRAALEQHVKRACYQAGHVWRQSLEHQPALPDVTEWGWERSQTSSGYTPTWTSLPVAELACLELIACKCIKLCRGNCVSATTQILDVLIFADVAGTAIEVRERSVL